ncbi:MAG: UvrD-helicase domain-containing protein [Phycisphaerae bacterium]
MSAWTYTDRQRQAIETMGRSVIVSAAAGSGKTAVLAERCAHLVCDLPPDQRCEADELLVLTFTEAAAAEMRSRIVEAIGTRARGRPADVRLRDQATLVDAAHISTIHAFCLWLIRRWFNLLGLEPTVSVLGDDEAKVMRREVLDALLQELYEEAAGGSDHPLGTLDDDGGSCTGSPSPVAVPTGPDDSTHRQTVPEAALAQAFVRLVDVYGLGSDKSIGDVVLQLHDFIASLPDPDAWLREACESLTDEPHKAVLHLSTELHTELTRQVDHSERVVETLFAGDPVGHGYARPIQAYAVQLNQWREALGSADDVSVRAGHNGAKRGGPPDAVARFEAVRRQIAAWEFPRGESPRLPKDADPGLRAARDAARAHHKDHRERLFTDRLKRRFALFSVDECVEGLAQTAPFVATLVDLVRRFRDAYAARKRELNVLDFADQERFAYRLLSEGGRPDRPSSIACRLHGRFAHVLVDEFQDINPIQEAIVRLASRECDPRRADNLFVVGDVKQSIYRFRLAEPAMFVERLERFAGEPDGGGCISLQRNFRSRPGILDTVNLLFGSLMRPGASSVVYDAAAVLHAGRTVEAKRAPQAVELHLLERAWNEHGGHRVGSAADPSGSGDDPDDEPGRGRSDPQDPARWTPIEREAYLIGTTLRHWIDEREPIVDDGPPRYRDVAILLRAKKTNAEKIAAVLGALGIPAYADAAGSFLDTREVRDVLATLKILDNGQQDIPLAGVLRSGILGDRFTVDELATIRCVDRTVPFHQCVRRVPEQGEDKKLGDRLTGLLDRIRRLRERARRCPLSETLSALYHEHGYFAAIGGLPNGSQRRENLRRFQELTRSFGTFRTQGLHRFLSFIAALKRNGMDLPVAPTMGEAEDVVRILSIHQAKGLEFPVVFVAGLGTKFNLGDRSGRMIFGRQSRIGLRVVDTQRMIEYPSAAHRRVCIEIERTTRDEELRVLYVAMTRARDKLVLVGSRRDAKSTATAGAARHAGTSPCTLCVAAAATPLDWIIPVLAGDSSGRVSGFGRPRGRDTLLEVRLHECDEMNHWRLIGTQDGSEQKQRHAVARCEPLPDTEPRGPDEVAEKVMSRIHYRYPWRSAAAVRASSAVGEFKPALSASNDPEERRTGPAPRDAHRTLSPAKGAAKDEAIRRGLVTHRVLEHLDFATAVNADGLTAEVRRMTDGGLIRSEDARLIDREALVWFLATPLAATIRTAGTGYRRELMYTAAESVDFLESGFSGASRSPRGGDEEASRWPKDDCVMVRGIVDGVVPTATGIEIVDFKTDAITRGQLDVRAGQYRPQLELYARAMSGLWRKPVGRCWLVFLHPRELVGWQPAVAHTP